MRRSSWSPTYSWGKYRSDLNFTLLVACVFAVSIIPSFGETVLFTSTTGTETYDFTLRSMMWLLGLFLGWGRRAVMTVRDRYKGDPAR